MAVRLLDAVTEQLHVAAACFHVLDDQGAELALVAQRGLSEAAAAALHTVPVHEQTLAGRAVLSRQLVSADLSKSRAEERDVRAMGPAGFAWALPIASDARVLGVLSGLSPAPLSPEALEVLSDLGAIASTSPGWYARTGEEQRSALDQASLRVAEALRILPPAQMRTAVQRGFQLWFAPPNENLPQSLRRVLQVMVREARLTAGAEMAALGIGDVPELSFDPWVFDGVPPEAEQRVGRHPRPVGTLGVVACEGKVVRVAQVKDHPAFRGLPPGHPDVSSLLGVPVRYGDQTLGNLYLGNKIGAPEFTEEDQRAVEVITTYVAIALQQTYLRAAVESQQARLETILESAPHGILFIDARTGRMIANPRATQLLGRPVDASQGHELYAALLRHPDGRAVTVDELPATKALRGEQPEAKEWLIVQGSGKEIAVVERCAPVLGFENQVLGAVISLEDRSAGKALERLRADLDVMEVLESATFEGIAVVENGRVILANEQLAALFACPIDQLTGRSPLDLVAPQSQQVMAGWLERHDLTPAEFVARRSDGTTFPCEAHSRQVVRPGRSWQVCAIRDITERKRVEEALRTSDRRKSEFLAVLSHELRNPLAPIRNSLYTLSHAAPGGEEADRALAIIDRQVGHLARLIDDLLDVTRITRGRIELKRERLDLVGLVKRTAEDYREEFLQRGVTLEVAPVSPEVWVKGDRTRLSQVIGNLLNNAAKFTPRGGRTVVSVRKDDTRRQATVQVQDTGRGIAPEMLPHMFEAFTQADMTLDRSQGGLGLGLALVKGLVEMHGGSVSAESGGPGQGATFIITLPLDTSIPGEPPARTIGGEERVHRVLVIEDNVDAADSLRDALRLHRHEVEVAYSGPEGLQKARDFEPDVVLCDIGLPEMDGFAVARAMRADPKLGRVRLVALSGYAQPEDVARAAEAGFDDHLAKPPTLEALERALGGGPPSHR